MGQIRSHGVSSGWKTRSKVVMTLTVDTVVSAVPHIFGDRSCE